MKHLKYSQFKTNRLSIPVQLALALVLSVGLSLWGLGPLLGGTLSSKAQESDAEVDQNVVETEPKVKSVQLASKSILKQGHTVVVEVETTAPMKVSMSVLLGSKRSPLFLQRPNHYEAVVGFGIDDATGSFPLLIQSGEGRELYKDKVTVSSHQFGRQNLAISKSTQGLQPIQGEMEAIEALKKTMSATRFWSLPFKSPTPDCQNSPFGTRRYYNGKYSGNYHKGVDLRSPAGRPIQAIADGKVQIATQKFRLHGGTVGLDHGQGFTSIYIHMSKVAVQPGDMVKQGQTIGYVGSTGFATGPHLHWGLYANGSPVNPNQWVPYHRC